MFWCDMSQSMSGFVADLARFQLDYNTCQALVDTITSMWVSKTIGYGSYMFAMDLGDTCMCLVPADSTYPILKYTLCSAMCVTQVLHDLNPQNWSIFFEFFKSKKSIRKSF